MKLRESVQLDIELLIEALTLLREVMPQAHPGDFSVALGDYWVQFDIVCPLARDPYYGNVVYRRSADSTDEALRKLIDETLRPEIARKRANPNPPVTWNFDDDDDE